MSDAISTPPQPQWNANTTNADRNSHQDEQRNNTSPQDDNDSTTVPAALPPLVMSPHLRRGCEKDRAEAHQVGETHHHLHQDEKSPPPRVSFVGPLRTITKTGTTNSSLSPMLQQRRPSDAVKARAQANRLLQESLSRAT